MQLASEISYTRTEVHSLLSVLLSGQDVNWYFISVMAFAVLALTIYTLTIRNRRIAYQRRILENQIKARTAKILAQKDEIEKQKELLEKEKEKSELLLRNILPQETAAELITKGRASARSYSMASVMFTDFKGFTKIAEKMRPKELIEQLDMFFGKFDEIIEKYSLEKIKTIGDSYMCAGGLPIRNQSNPIDIVMAAMEIQNFIEDYNAQQNERDFKWELRIGINTGELIAGVIGKKRFAYDIWGDTVNVANRLETAGEPGKINVSGSTYEYIKDFFVCKKRGKIAVKNKGEIEMYYVERLKPELSSDELGRVPNAEFSSRLSQLLVEKFNYKKSEQRIIKLLAEKLPEGLYYHGIHHTMDVIRAAEEIARSEGIDGEDLFLLKTAALFHDAGFVSEYSKNEKIGAQIAREMLPQFGYTESQIDTVEKIIMATELPQSPTNLIESVMCDADLDYLGRDDFHEISDSLKRELLSYGKISGDRQWDQMQITFLENHKYFTATNQNRREPEKQKRIMEIKQRLIENKYES
jgi:class 3 adenylate cyclase/predicted metal-dependent HD superfamily phosphohydrolase